MGWGYILWMKPVPNGCGHGARKYLRHIFRCEFLKSKALIVLSVSWSIFCIFDERKVKKQRMEYKAKYITGISAFLLWGQVLQIGHHVRSPHADLVYLGRNQDRASGCYLSFKKGDIFLIPRHQLATIINYPKDGRKRIKRWWCTFPRRGSGSFTGKLEVKPKALAAQRILCYNHHPLLESCISSLIPYFEMQDLPKDLASLKITEAITILRTIDKGIDDVLANFWRAGQDWLVGYMEKNFMFNLPLVEKFGYLTGRSTGYLPNGTLEKRFNMTPQEVAHPKAAGAGALSICGRRKSRLMCAMKWGLRIYRIFRMHLKNSSATLQRNWRGKNTLEKWYAALLPLVCNEG